MFNKFRRSVDSVVTIDADRHPMTNLRRTLMAFRCTDCDRLPKAPEAGRIYKEGLQDVQIMHNGLKVVAGGYYGDWMAHLIRGLKGHHEPQEELIFSEVVRRARHGGTFVELGSFWCFYSLWFLDAVPSSRAICVEPDPKNMAIGQANAALNRLSDRIRFHTAMISGESVPEVAFVPETLTEPTPIPSYNFHDIRRAAENHIEVLHLDIQGYETAFLRSLPDTVNDVRFVVVSTHHVSISGSETTHADCLLELTRHGAHILTEHSVEESFSGDGLIVASFLNDDLEVEMPAISKNTRERSLFG